MRRDRRIGLGDDRGGGERFGLARLATEGGEQLRPVAALLVDGLEDARRLGAKRLVGEERLESFARTGMLRV